MSASIAERAMAAPRRKAGLGWSRICMLALKKCRIGEAQAAGGCGKRRKNAQGRTFSFGTVKLYAQNRLQAAEKRVVMQ